MIKKADRAAFMGKLRDRFPNPESELAFTTPFELLVAVMLSAQATDKGVNIAFMRLFREAKGHTAYTIVESDGRFPEGIEEPLRDNPNVRDVMIIEP